MSVPQASQDAFKYASGTRIPVWEALVPRSKVSSASSLEEDLDTHVCVVGSGIAGLTTCYELLQQQTKPVVLLESRDLLAGESARTTGHLASGDQGERFYELIKIFGHDGARLAYEGHQYALERIGQICKELHIDCEYRRVPAIIYRAPDGEDNIKKEFEAMKELNIPGEYMDQNQVLVGDRQAGPALKVADQATFNPTMYLTQLISALQRNPEFSAYTNTRYMSHEASADSRIKVTAVNDEGNNVIVSTDHIVLATNIPPRKMSNILKQHYYRTYAIAVVVPAGQYPDELLYSNHDMPYIYVRKTSHPEADKEYLIVGGEDHLVGMKHKPEDYRACFEHLERWTREHYKLAGAVEYQWSGQTINSCDGLAFIGQSGLPHEYIITGDNGNGLTHGTLGARIVAGQIAGRQNKFADLWRAERKPTKTIMEEVKEGAQHQLPYLDYLKPLSHDVEDLPLCKGKIVRGHLTEGGKPIAVYKDGDGHLHRFTAVCPHMKGLLAWNEIEESFDCPVHGSRFAAKTGKCIMGPAKTDLHPQPEEKLHHQPEEKGSTAPLGIAGKA
jgi:glycine/D-amino acid oxidase-like deaminating enzyme/nitrite reductase/ring-hydroxylating ferredoxin subunit